MNTIDIKFNNEITSFSELYKEAKNQFLDYEKIEGIENWEEYDFSIDCAEDQHKFKDMLQIRFIEELTEASMAMNEPEEHFWEEMGDALNFFLSAMIMINAPFEKLTNPEDLLSIDTQKKVPTHEEFSYQAYQLVEKTGYLCNLLKNRRWAQSNYLVSLYDFELRLQDLWTTFWLTLGNMGVVSRDVFEMFWKKYQVNKHRMSTGY